MAKNKKRKKKLDARQTVMLLCIIIAIGSFGYLAFYNYQASHSSEQVDNLNKVKEKSDGEFVLHKAAVVTLDEADTPDILEEYADVFRLNQKLIGWIKIDGTKVDYPVMQTSNNEYYLDHNYNQEYDKNGSLFLDKDCDAAFPNDNMIIYGHHMKSGKMFGNLNYYSKESFWEDNKEFTFDTIYETGTYAVMYVFRSKIYSEEEIVFKYYQFIDATSENEFNSNMEEMANMSLYDTGVTASYGDRLITLSTCDSSEEDGRFVVVAKKIK